MQKNKTSITTRFALAAAAIAAPVMMVASATSAQAIPGVYCAIPGGATRCWSNDNPALTPHAGPGGLTPGTKGPCSVATIRQFGRCL